MVLKEQFNILGNARIHFHDRFLFVLSPPSLCLPQATFVFSLVSWAPLNLGKGLVAPAWATTLGWLLTFSSVSLLPIWAVYALATTPGTLKQVTSTLFKHFHHRVLLNGRILTTTF